MEDVRRSGDEADSPELAPRDPGPTAEAQAIHLAGAIGGGRRTRLIRVLVTVGLVLGAAVIVLTLVQALTTG